VVALLAAENWMNEDLIGHLDLPQVMPTMAWLSTRRLPAFFAQALGGTHKPIGGGRQTAVMAIFGLLPFQGFDALLQGVDQPFEDVHTLLPRTNGDDGLFEPFAQVLIRLLRLFQLGIFVLQRFAQCPILSSQLVQFFIFRHAATLADCPSFRNCIALLNSYIITLPLQSAIIRGCHARMLLHDWKGMPEPIELKHREVLPLTVVDKSDISPTRLTAWQTRRILASRGVLLSSHF